MGDEDNNAMSDSYMSEDISLDDGTTTESGEPGAAVATELGFLCVVEGNRKGDRIPIVSGNVCIGKSADNDIQLDDPGIAETHAEITYSEDKYILHNLDVLGRCLVNGMQTKECALNDGDTISFGSFKMRIEFSSGSSHSI